jgi:NAD(P)-dependent dehydrogenase (short-subunit alcohol dehydrogenase family)
MESVPTTKPVVAVFGATGHTGRFVVAELLRRGMAPIAIARDPAALAAIPQFEVMRRQASVDDPTSLAGALRGAQAVINCAGPFADTAAAVAGAAVCARIHYVDVSAEQGSVRSLLERFHEPAREAGIAVVPSMAFYGGLADLLVSAARDDWYWANSVEIMIGLDSWHPTRGTRVTLDRNVVGNLMITGGRLVAAAPSGRRKHWDFGAGLGEQDLIEVPFAETVLVPMQLGSDELHNYLSEVAVNDVLDPSTPHPNAADALGRSAQRFVVDVVLTRNGECRRAIVRGQDIYAFTAPLACAAVERLLEGRFHIPGANSPGFIFDADNLLASLGPDHATFEVIGLDRPTAQDRKPALGRQPVGRMNLANKGNDPNYHKLTSQCIRSLQCMEIWLDKAEQFAAAKNFDVGVLLTSRLAPDMKDFTYQVQSACDYVKAAAAWLSGQTPPRHDDNERTIDELRARIRKTVTFAEGVSEQQYIGASERRVSLSWAPGKVIGGEDYLVQLTIPNLFFHLTTAYAILRHNGVDVGKMDFLGSMNFVEA